MFFTRRFLLVTAFSVSAFAHMAMGGEQAPPAAAMSPEQEAAMVAQLGLPAGSRLRVVEEHETGGKTDETRTGTSVGPSLRVEGDKITGTIDGKPVEISLSDLGLTASGGGFAAKNTAETSRGAWWADWKFWVGLLCLLSAGALWIIPHVAPTLIRVAIPAPIVSGLGIAGGCLLFAAFFPVLATILTVVGVVFILGPKIIGAVQQANLIGTLRSEAAASSRAAGDGAAAAEKHLSALDEVMEAVVNDPAAAAALKRHLDTHADDDDVPLIMERFKAAGGRFA